MKKIHQLHKKTSQTLQLQPLKWLSKPKLRQIKFKAQFSSFMAACFMLFGVSLSSVTHAQITQTDLKNLLECQSDYQHYSALTDDYEKQLSQLGWQRVENTDQPFIYIYQSSKPTPFFGLSTQQIGLTGNAIVAILRDVDVQSLAKRYALTQHEFFQSAPYFRGEKTLRTETPEDEQIPVHHKLMLSEMTGKDPIVLLGCNYELDREAMEKALADLEE